MANNSVQLWQPGEPFNQNSEIYHVRELDRIFLHVCQIRLYIESSKIG
jgi:hypothetical protein